MAPLKTLIHPKCLLGEGATWLDTTQDPAHGGSWYWVDIKQARVHAWRVRTQQHVQWDLPEWVGWIVPCVLEDAPYGVVLGLRQRVVLAHLHDDGRVEITRSIDVPLPDLPHAADLRINDGKADTQGTIWFGVMNNVHESAPHGRLYRLHRDWTIECVMTELHIPNGPAFSADGRRIWWADSSEQQVWTADLDAQGSVSAPRVWLNWQGSKDGYPDGMTVDAQGNFWVAHWGAGCVSCHSADDAHELMRVPVPARQPTSVCFGGVDRRQLLVTSAHIGLSPVGAFDGAVFLGAVQIQSHPDQSPSHPAQNQSGLPTRNFILDKNTL